ncbi:MAG: RNA methyltransferase [Nitrospira sp.]|nr:RNA methyltransferase [Nitrospira sp.]
MGTGLHLQTLTRAQSSLIRQLLRQKTARSSERAFVVEGVPHCLDLISQHPQAIRSLLVSPGYLRVETEAARAIRSRLQIRQLLCSDLVFKQVTDVETPQGILAVVQQPQWDEEHILRRSRVLGIYGDRLRDPANVGAIIRTAAALNLSGVWLTSDSADHFSPKVVRTTAGTLLNIPVFRTPDFQPVALSGCEIYSAVVSASDRVPIRDIRTIPRRLMIAVGNEGAGLSLDIMKASQVRFFIPLSKGVESLNVAATVAISAFYFSGLPTDSGVHREKSPPSA